MNAAEIAQYCYARYVLSMKRQYTSGLLAQTSCAFGRWDMLVDMLVLLIVGGCDLCQESGNHFNNVGDRHLTYFILLTDILFTTQRMSRTVPRAGEYLFASEALYMVEVADFDPGW